jgi:hypothetical protein
MRELLPDDVRDVSGGLAEYRGADVAAFEPPGNDIVGIPRTPIGPFEIA